MFRFAGQIGRQRFFWGAALRIGLFLACVAGFPFLLATIAEATGCRGMACRAVAVFTAMVVKPVVFALFAFSFAGLAMRRARDSGLPAWLGLGVVGLLAADYRILAFGGEPWSLAFLAKALQVSPPWFALLGLACIAVLCLLPRRGADALCRDPLGVPTVALPVKSLLIAALVLTPVAVASALPGGTTPALLPVALVMQVGSTMVPTFVVYACFLLALALAVARRAAGPAVILVLAALPFAHWAWGHWDVSHRQAREAAEIAAVPTVPVPHVPATLVFESDSNKGIEGVWAIPGIQTVIVKGDSRGMTQFDRPSAEVRLPLPKTVATLPEEYLLLKVGPVSAFARVGRDSSTVAGPLELRFVDSRRNLLVAVWYRSLQAAPASVPLLTMSGWYRRTDVTATEDIEARIRTFLEAALGPTR